MSTKSHRSSHTHVRKSHRNMGLSGPPTGATTYKGSIMASKFKEGTPVELNISSISILVSTSVANVYTFNTVVSCQTFTAQQDFTDMAALYQEFRVLGIETHYVPTDQNSATPFLITSQSGPFFLAPYHGDATVLTSSSAAFQHTPCVFACVNQPLKASVRMSESDEAQWFSTTSGTVPVMGIKAFFTAYTAGATDTIVTGMFCNRALFQFRGRVQTATGVKKSLSLLAPTQDSKDSKSKESSSALPSSSSLGTDEKSVAPSLCKEEKSSIAIDEGYVLPKLVLSRESDCQRSSPNNVQPQASVPFKWIAGKSVTPQCKIR